MGKTMSFKHEEEEVEDMNPSCIRVLISAIDYHHRLQYSVQKLLPHKRNHGTRAKEYRNSNLSSQVCDIGENHEEENVLSSKKKHASTKRRSLRACIKKLISHPITKEGNDKVLGSTSLSQSRIQRNISMHHYCRDVSSNWGHSIIFFPGNKDVQSIKLQDPNKFGEYTNVFKVDDGSRKFSGPLPSSRATARLIKYGSFPAANLSQKTWLKSSKLNRKGTETWCPLRMKTSPDATPLIKNTLNYCYKENITKSGHRRSYSLNELLDKCTLFSESNLGKERRLHNSTSLNMEYEAYRTNPSFSNYDKFSPFQFGVNKEAIFADWPVISSEESILELNPNFLSARTPEAKKTGAQYEMLKADCCAQETDDLAESVGFSARISDATLSDNAEDHDELAVEEMKSTREQTNNNTAIRFSEFPFAAECFSSIDTASTIQELRSAEGLEKESDLFHYDSSINRQNTLDKSLTSCVENLHDSINNEDPNCIEDLECSGFFKNTLNSTWHALDKPLINSLFEEIKVFLQQELKFLKEDSWHYQLLLDLVNEELVHLHDKSSSYYPKALSRSCHIRRFPVGNKILEEVCNSISALMNLMPEEKEWIDCVVDLDMRRDDSWMNLQWESECVLIDVENIIFHELLEEFQC